MTMTSSPTQRLCEDVNDASLLEREGNLPGYRLTDDDYKLFDVYHYWVHKTNQTYLDVGIEKYGKWQ